jgi:hypothetical protein
MYSRGKAPWIHAMVSIWTAILASCAYPTSKGSSMELFGEVLVDEHTRKQLVTKGIDRTEIAKN